jgi:hypothetical protein
MKPNWQGRGNNELSFAQAVERKLLKFDLSIWQQLDRRQINDNQALQKFKVENERQAREAIAQGLTEAFDKPYELLRWEKGDFGDVDAIARLDDGTFLSIMFNKGFSKDSKEEAWSVEFYRNNSQEVTGEGDQQRVFATVLSAIQTFIKKYTPNRITFTASKEVEQGQNAQSRARLYDSLVQRYARAWGFRAFRADTGNKVIYELSRIKQPVAEGSLSEYRDQLWTWVQSKFPRTQWPEYVQRDFLYAKAKGNKNQKDLEDFLDEIQQDFGNCKWTLTKIPITLDIFTPKTQRMIQSREGGSSNPFQVPKDAERHALQSQMIQQKGVSAEPIIVAKLANGYDLIEGWHRTIQHLKAFPQGYTGPAWVCTGATYKSESVEQGVAEGMEHYNGIEISLEKEDDEILITAMMPGGRELGHVLFVQEGDYLMPQDLEVEERYQGQGIAATMYDYVKSKGYKIRRSGQQTDAGAGFWDKHRPEQNVWEQEIDENFADGKNPGRKGLSRRVGIPKKATLGQLEKIAQSSTGERRRMAQWQLNMRRGKKK